MQYVCTTTRRVARQTTPLIRRMSSKPNPQTPPPSFALPPEKLRALISLYHQSKSFITPENLDEAIDRAFVEVPSMTFHGNRRLDWPTLRLEAKERRTQPKYGLPESLESPISMYASGYKEKEDRMEKVFDALYGTYEVNKPGLELLQDVWEHTEEQLRTDGKEEQHS
ncbi:hypothetical protein BC834DRAFT_865591 [Gloeopeniophorella convolvens]|nr:hypothetical protein BC834DRAFT_865591 [Gloeopeniophorella convolvens]